MPEKETTLLDYAHVLVRWRKTIVINFLIVCILAAVLSFILPKWYTATTSILPPEEEGLGLGLSSMLSSLPVSGLGGLAGMTTPGAIYVAILESRTVREGVVRTLDLMKDFRSKNMEEAIGKLSKRTNIDLSEEGIVTLKVTARTPQQAAQIANTYIAELNKKNTDLSVAQARNNRIFVEGRLSENEEDLHKAEEDLRRFQEQHKAISLPEQTAAAIEAAALVMGEMQTLEVQRDVLLTTMRPTNPQVFQVQVQIDALRRQLNRMEFGTENAATIDTSRGAVRNKEFYVPFSRVPEVGLELARLMREVKIQEVIFELLTQQYEQAKLQEAKDTPTVQVLDSAVPPVKKSRPNRKAIVLMAGALSLVSSIFLAFFAEYARRLKTDSRTSATAEGILSALRHDGRRIKRFFYLSRN